jgi:hypothetical protein
MRIFLFLACALASIVLQAQTIPLGSPILESFIRRQQLLGEFDSSFSFNYRPLVIGENGVAMDHQLLNPDHYFRPVWVSAKKTVEVRLLPAELKFALDRLHPDSRNDGAMVRSRGIQTMLSAGFYSKIGPLTVQLKPEFVWAQNKDYLGFPPKPRHWESTWRSRYLFFNRIDQPERYGTEPYKRLIPGQSSIRISYWGISLGLSTENIWWGPSIRNSLMMSNNAQGFPHITLNTQRAIKTPIGNIEGQFITGRLEGSGYDPPGAGETFLGKIQFVPKKDDWRYFQAITFSFSPKWVHGLSFGFTRWVQQYWETAQNAKDYFPSFSNLFRNKETDVFGLESQQDQAAGLFGRWFWVDAKSEFYFEFGMNDASLNLRDLLVDTDHSRAITLGFNKLLPTTKKDVYYQILLEWTQTSQTESRYFRNAFAWYIHHAVRHGYTNNGEVLGSALGPGGNAQYFEVAWTHEKQRIGGALERFVHNNDFATYTFAYDYTRYWVDYSIRAFSDWELGNFLLKGSVLYTRSLNYQWEVIYDPGAVPFEYYPGKDRDNINIDISLLYNF